ncbi:MAG: Verru_Chthon cassette protein D [Chthoniobacterales bacterium]
MQIAPPIPATRRAFSLVETLTVIALIAVLAGLTLPAVNHIQSASALTTTSGQLMDLLNLARQQSLTQNRPVEVRFYKLPDPSDASRLLWRGVQIFKIDNGTATPLDRPSYFPPQVKISENTDYSNILDDSRSDITSGSGSDIGLSLPGVGTNYSYRAFRFRPNGTTTLASPIFATLQPSNARSEGNAPAANWFTVQVDSLNGSIQTFRPE